MVSLFGLGVELLRQKTTSPIVAWSSRCTDSGVTVEAAMAFHRARKHGIHNARCRNFGRVLGVLSQTFTE